MKKRNCIGIGLLVPPGIACVCVVGSIVVECFTTEPVVSTVIAIGCTMTLSGLAVLSHTGGEG